MMHRNSLNRNTSLLPEAGATKNPIRITLFTSDTCAFCDEAREVVKEAVERVPFYQPYIEVVESPVDKKPVLTERHQVLVVPTVFVANSRIIGMPRVDDLEQLIHQEMLSQHLR
ncbi:MAG: glutaredoxin family protein [Candidatus Thorarchaeota archaeon]|jgi:protein-disulfide isomerase